MTGADLIAKRANDINCCGECTLDFTLTDGTPLMAGEPHHVNVLSYDCDLTEERMATW